MTLNLKAHEREILSAYNDVVRSPNSQNWLILDYEGNSNVLKIGDTGDAGIEELSVSFNSGKLQYGIAAVRSTAASQPKMILIHWQGEGVPSARLAATTSHANDLKRFLRGIHVVIIARSEDDVDPESILKAVAKLPTMNDVKRIEDVEPVPQGPVGSVYTPIKPNRDIDLSERDQFWKKVEAEEASRIVEERRRASQKDAEADRDKAELSKRIHAKLTIDDGAHNNAPSANGHPRNAAANTNGVSGGGSAGLIRGRKAMFEQKANELSESAVLKHPPVRHVNLPLAKTATPAASVVLPSTEQQQKVHTPNSPPSLVASSQQQQQQHGILSSNSPPSPPMAEAEPVQQRVRTPSPAPVAQPTEVPLAEVSQPPQQPVETIPAYSAQSYYEEPPVEAHDDLRAVALWDYQAADDTEITFDPDDIITEIEQIDEGWWRGRGPDGRVGLFPANYVSLI
ncbi:Drebrin-like protein [Toxocara canis]|uniref:Drebrin-like protein n=2 Tax=Toxocara canis TaxID=6265 RepID=A0A0B2VC05_TOXCA|nr:Drebrin-like protein [Toxocara canis]VDM39018.1 unnamed protein product [Toxocara canis]